ncbi:UDP-glycosyltransferase UGT5-like [Anastrepha ludens]|uniref:UDP-glycosyltransferase UGT5-like n=1 Tax=Anastrepha ludens TaxID=28586 RepID=UPI0023B1C2D6|nr:UDP-glycosyltransferase UGT5-like [Anastrepha ludens]
MPAHAARILGFFPTSSKSHNLIHNAIADALARAGHNVTVIGIMKNVYPKAPYKFIQIDPTEVAQTSQLSMKNMVSKPKHFYLSLFTMPQSISAIDNQTLNHPKMLEFLRNNGVGAFDLVILGYSLNDYAMGLGAHFRCPIVSSFQIQPTFVNHRLVGNPAEQSYVPMLFSNLKQPLTFMDRVVNYLANFLEQWILLPIFEREWLKVYK